MSTKRARQILQRFKHMKRRKAPWLRLYQLCAEYVMSRKQSFTEQPTVGEIQTDHLYDDMAIFANTKMSASIIGMLWPKAAKSFRISMPLDMADEEETEELKTFYEWQTKRMAYYMDDPKAGFATALEEYMLDQGAFGISGIHTMDNEDDFNLPVSYRAEDAKVLFIDEGENGFINRIYISREYTVRQMVEKYGFDNISKIHQKAFLDGDDDNKVQILHAIEPRVERDPFAFGNQAMPIASIHIDESTEKILKEGGFIDLPIAVTRFWKGMGEVYGRCPAMQALPSIFEANALGHSWTLAVEKTLDPSLLVLDDGAMGGGVIDTSPGGITVVSVSGRIGSNQVPIQPMFLVGDLQWTAARRTELGEIIGKHFYNDLLFDFNSDQRMQNPEVFIRDRDRGQTLNTTLSRQLAEQFVPTLETTYNILFRKGLLGVIPGSNEEIELLQRGIEPRYIPQRVIERMLTGQEAYRIEFISPATRIMNTDELQGIEHLITTTINTAAVNPDVLDVVDWDWTLRRVQELDGSPRETIRSLEKLKQLREDKQAMQQEMMDLERQRLQSETARNAGQAASSVGVTLAEAA